MNKYVEAFEAERVRAYPEVDDVEARCGYAVPRDRLENAARVLACPVKVNPPCWQHGRVIYAVLRAYAEHNKPASVVTLDIGTAKGFSALCAVWACSDAGVPVLVHSVDVIDPAARVARNTVAEIDGLKTLYETVAPWPESRAVRFQHAKAENWLMMRRERLNFAFVDGKHTYEAVSKELGLLSNLQEKGDVVVADDLQVPGVLKAVRETKSYKTRVVQALPNRLYAVMVRL